MTALPRPVITPSGGTFAFASFPSSATINSNGALPGVSKLMYRINSGAWVEYTGTPVPITPAMNLQARNETTLPAEYSTSSIISQTYYRLERVRFSTPYISLRHALLFNRASVAEISGGQAPDETLRTFNGRIGVIGRSAYVDFARRNFPRAQILERTNWDNAVAGLLDRSLDAIYRDEFEIKRLLKIRPALNVQFGAAVITDQHAYLSVAICDSCSKLQEFINYHLTQVQGIFTLPRLLASDLSD